MMYEQKIIENLREFSAKYQYEDQKLSETCFRAANAIEELQKPQWISVEERLPDIGRKVLVFAYGHEILTARMKKQTENSYPVFEWYGKFLEMAKPGRITHWQPLPEPPKEETGGMGG